MCDLLIYLKMIVLMEFLYKRKTVPVYCYDKLFSTENEMKKEKYIN